MQNKFTLTIAIPTWNRCEFLKKNLNILLNHHDGYLKKNICVVVHDNNSDDETNLVIQQYVNNNNFRYYKNLTNIGVSENIKKCYDFCDTEYLQILGDDDFYFSLESLHLILKILLKKNVYAVFIEPYGFIANHIKEKNIVLKNSDKNVLHFDNIIDFINEISEQVTLISAIIFKKSTCLNPIFVYTADSELNHVRRLLNSIYKGDNFVCLKYPILGVTSNNSIVKDFRYIFIYDFLIIIEQLFVMEGKQSLYIRYKRKYFFQYLLPYMNRDYISFGNKIDSRGNLAVDYMKYNYGKIYILFTLIIYSCPRVLRLFLILPAIFLSYFVKYGFFNLINKIFLRLRFSGFKIFNFFI